MMENKPLQEFYRLIEQEQYRDAMGILESEAIDPAIAAKWQAWLEELHREDRIRAGVASPKQTAQPNQRFYEHAKLIGSLVGMPLFTLIFTGVMLAFALIPSLSFVVPLVAVAGSYLGWRWTIQLFVHNYVNEISAVVWIGLIAYSFFSLPRQLFIMDWSGYLLAMALLLFLPFTLHMGWRLGEEYGLQFAKWRRPELPDDKK